LTNFTTAFAQQANVTDSIYNIQDSVLIPTRSGIALSAIIVRKKMNTTPLLIVLITRVQVTPYLEKGSGQGSQLVILLNVNKHPFEVINDGSGKPVSEETIKRRRPIKNKMV
jgi:hypothetical protein